MVTVHDHQARTGGSAGGTSPSAGDDGATTGVTHKSAKAKKKAKQKAKAKLKKLSGNGGDSSSLSSQKNQLAEYNEQEEMYHHHAGTSPLPYSYEHREDAYAAEYDDEDSEEDHRGRSRRPRLLWKSQLDHFSLNLLDSHCVEARGAPLPRLRRQGSEEGKKWSRALEKVGL